MTQAALGVEVVGEIIRKDGQRIPVTYKAIPEYIKLLTEFVLNESLEDFLFAVRSHEELFITLSRVLNLTT